MSDSGQIAFLATCPASQSDLRMTMTEEAKQKFTSRVRRGLNWVHAQTRTEFDRLKETGAGGRVPGFSAGELSDIEAALVWIEQNKEPRPG